MPLCSCPSKSLFDKKKPGHSCAVGKKKFGKQFNDSKRSLLSPVVLKPPHHVWKADTISFFSGFHKHPQLLGWWSSQCSSTRLPQSPLSPVCSQTRLWKTFQFRDSRVSMLEMETSRLENSNWEGSWFEVSNSKGAWFLLTCQAGCICCRDNWFLTPPQPRAWCDCRRRDSCPVISCWRWWTARNHFTLLQNNQVSLLSFCFMSWNLYWRRKV